MTYEPRTVAPADSDLAYDAGYYRQREQDLAFQREIGWLFEQVRPAPGRRLLELGCGGGALLAAAQRRGWQASGLDLNATALRLARQAAHGALVVRAAARTLPFASGVFDLIMAQHLIEHCETPALMVAECRRVLAPGGQIVLVTPNALYPDPALFADPTHRQIFTARELRALFEQAGFRTRACFTLRPYLSRRLYRWAVRGERWLRDLPYCASHGAVVVLAAHKP